jgi:hypothetical protein
METFRKQERYSLDRDVRSEWGINVIRRGGKKEFHGPTLHCLSFKVFTVTDERVALFLPAFQ